MKQIVQLKEPLNAVNNPNKLFDRISKIDIDFTQENFLLFTLDTRLQVISTHNLFKGGIDGIIVDPRTLFRKVLLDNATAFIIAHNHPSGQLEPSQEDVDFTKTVKKQAEFLNITFCDHVVFNQSEYYSLCDSGDI